MTRQGEADLCIEIEQLQELNNDLIKTVKICTKEVDALKSALNMIAILGCGADAYTSKFTEQVMDIVYKALTGKDRGL